MNLRPLLALTLSVALAPAALAQRTTAPTTLSTINPRAIGPAVASGRVVDIAVHPTDKSLWYVAAASGGVWKTTNNGTTFTPIFDNEGSYSIGVVTLDPKNPHVVWVGTGESNGQRSVGWGDGVYKSEDGGKSWRNVGLKTSEHIGRIVVDPRRSDTVWVAAQGPLWGPGGERGLYKTEDGGKTWKLSLKISENTGVSDVVLDPRNPDTVYATSWQRRRHVFTYVGGGPESAIWRSTDGGATWNRLRGGLPGGDQGRIGLAISPANPDYLYATVEASGGAGGTYRSLDYGASWEKRGDFVAQGMYYGQIVCDPKDPERIYLLSVTNMVSDDGGRTVQPLGERNKHVDNHALWIDPTDTRHYLAGCDGGVYESFDRGATWVFKSNLPLAQFYRIAVDDSRPFYFVYGGTQDNNSLGGPSRSASSRGVGSAEWFVTAGGDGFHQAVDPTDPNTVYSESQDGGLVRFDRRTGLRVGIAPLPGKGEPPLRFYWDAPLRISPHAPRRLYYGANILFRSDDRGDSWKAISPDLTRQIDRNTLPVMGQVPRLDAVARGQSTSFYGNIISLDESPRREGLLYVGTDDGLIQVTEDGGKAWRKIERVAGVPEGTYVGRILASQHSADVVYALFDNHKRADFAPYVLRSADRGATWTSIAGNLPAGGPALSLAEDHVDPNLLFVGTEFGLFVTYDGGKAWHKVRGLPTVPVRDLKVQKRENDLVVGTFGRGIYIVDDYTALRAEATLKDREAAILPMRDIRLFVPYDGGTGSEGETPFTAPNPPSGAQIPIYLKESPKTLKQKREDAEAEARRKGETPPYPTPEQLRAEAAEEPPLLVLTISDSRGTPVRRLTTAAVAGLRRIAWDLRGAPLSAGAVPTGGRGGRGGGGGGGFAVLPGDYRLSLARRVDGVETELVKDAPLRLMVDGEDALNAADRKALLEFRDRVTKLQRAFTGTTEVLDSLTARVAAIRGALDDSPAATPALRQEARALATALREIDRALRGDDTAATLVQPAPLTLVRRVSDATFSQLASPLPPTKTRLDSLAVASSELAALLPGLQRIAREGLPKLEKALDAAGIPHTPGRIPEYTGR